MSIRIASSPRAAAIFTLLGAATIHAQSTPAPVVQVGTVTQSTVRLDWTFSAMGLERFRIERRSGIGSFQVIGVTALPPVQSSALDSSKPAAADTTPSTFSFTDSGLSPNTTYTYRIRAEIATVHPRQPRVPHGSLRTVFSPYSNEVTATTLAALAAPTAVQAVAVGPTQVNVTWNASDTNATSLQIERKTGTTGIYALLATVPPTPSSYQDKAITANTTYSYRVRSQASSGFSGYSNETSVTNTCPSPAACSESCRHRNVRFRGSSFLGINSQRRSSFPGRTSNRKWGIL